MVVYDIDNNGYRDQLLPLALHDPLVQRAVSVVSALHLGLRQPDLRRYAEVGRAAIIARLRQDAMSGSVENVSTLATWATLIILLVGETVTGSSEFVHLFSMLRTLSSLQSDSKLGSQSMWQFLDCQTKLYVRLMNSAHIIRETEEGRKPLLLLCTPATNQLISLYSVDSNYMHRHY